MKKIKVMHKEYRKYQDDNGETRTAVDETFVHRDIDDKTLDILRKVKAEDVMADFKKAVAGRALKDLHRVNLNYGKLRVELKFVNSDISEELDIRNRVRTLETKLTEAEVSEYFAPDYCPFYHMYLDGRQITHQNYGSQPIGKLPQSFSKIVHSADTYNVEGVEQYVIFDITL